VTDGDFVEWLAAETGLDAGDIAGWDLMFHDIRHRRSSAATSSSRRAASTISCRAGRVEALAVGPVDQRRCRRLVRPRESGSTRRPAPADALETVIDRLVRPGW
jgi:hypothetical protein